MEVMNSTHVVVSTSAIASARMLIDMKFEEKKKTRET